MRDQFRQLDESLATGARPRAGSRGWILRVMKPEQGTEERSTFPVAIVGHQDMEPDRFQEVVQHFYRVAKELSLPEAEFLNLFDLTAEGRIGKVMIASYGNIIWSLTEVEAVIRATTMFSALQQVVKEAFRPGTEFTFREYLAFVRDHSELFQPEKLIPGTMGDVIQHAGAAYDFRL